MKTSLLHYWLCTLLLLTATAGIYSPANAATCSCAGVPLLAAINTTAIEKGQLNISYSAEQHQISDLVSGSEAVSDGTRRDRASLSQVISASYAISDRWSVSGLLSYVEHHREIGSSFLGPTDTSGMGDSVILARYTPLFITPFSRNQISMGLGARIASGEDNYTLNGRPVSEDMQPSVGASGQILWGSYSYAFNQAATVLFNASTNYTFNDENNRDYTFGDELNFALGLSQNIGTKFSYSAGLRYRSTRADKRFDFEIPNTGGKWLDFVPAIQYSFNDRLGISLSGRIPLARDLNGVLQFTTSYAYGLSLSYDI